MVNTISTSNKINNILEKQKKDILNVFESAISEINEEARSEEKKEFISNFIADAVKVSENLKTRCDFIDYNQNDSKMKNKVQQSFDDLARMLALFDECKSKDNLKYDTFAYIASSYGIRYNEALILFAAACVDIEAIRAFAHSHMSLLKFQIPANEELTA